MLPPKKRLLDQVRELAGLSFVERAHNVIVLGADKKPGKIIKAIMETENSEQCTPISTQLNDANGWWPV